MRKAKERDAPERPGSDDDMTGMDKVLRDRPCISQTLFVSREESETGGPAWLVGAPPPGSLWGWFVQATGSRTPSTGVVLMPCRGRSKYALMETSSQSCAFSS